jgi:hypothetical protein
MQNAEGMGSKQQQHQIEPQQQAGPENSHSINGITSGQHLRLGTLLAADVAAADPAACTESPGSAVCVA